MAFGINRITMISNNERGMMFIDGENILCRYEAIQKSNNFVKEGGVKYKEDEYVFSHHIVKNGNIWRIHFYQAISSRMASDISQKRQLVEDIKSLTHRSNLSIIPHLFPRSDQGKERKGSVKGDDISMAVDILTNAYNGNYDTAYIVTCDSDFTPVIEEVMRAGKRVVLMAFKKGINPDFNHIADEFVELESIFFNETE